MIPYALSTRRVPQRIYIFSDACRHKTEEQIALRRVLKVLPPHRSFLLSLLFPITPFSYYDSGPMFFCKTTHELLERNAAKVT